MVYYVGYYNCDEIRGEERLVAPPSENKMNYITTALAERSGNQVQVVTLAETAKCRWVKGKNTPICQGVNLKTFASFNSKNKLLRGLGHLLTKGLAFTYLLTHLKKEDHLVVYHSLFVMKMVRRLKRLKQCTLTLEVEELYSDVTGDEAKRQQEIDYLQIADRYIFITPLLRDVVNTKKPSVISFGTYQPIPDLGFRFEDGKIHVVYAGVLSRVKGGAFTAISAARYLDDGYVLEILGKGSPKEEEEVRRAIDEVAPQTTCKINFVGYKSGDDFNAYIQACHIGLSTQQADAKFNATSFPSKVLMYLSNGLRVVSVKIPAVTTSVVDDYMVYYDCQDGEQVADAIRSGALNDGFEPRAFLQDLHGEFVTQLSDLLQ